MIQPLAIERPDLEALPDAPADMTEEQMLDVCEAIWETPEHYIQRFLVIKTKDEQLVKLKLNRTQLAILKVIKKRWAAKKPVRLIILKARQEGVSTFFEALFIAITMTNPNTTMWVIAHERGASENLFGMSEMYLDQLDEHITPMVSNRDKKRIRFRNPDQLARKRNPGLNSKVYVDQAKNASAGRSDTINLLHISERAFWGPQGTKTFTSLMQAVPSHWRTVVVQESTANGVQDSAGFYDAWNDNYGDPDAEWLCLFFPWFIHDEYTMEVEEKYLDGDRRLMLVEDPDGEMREQALRDGIDYMNVDGVTETHRLTDGQIRWRRWAIKERCSGDPYVFMQEFPSTPEEAFVQSGRPWFDKPGLEYVRKCIKEPIAVGILRTPTPTYGMQTEFREDHFHHKDVKHGQNIPEFVKTGNGDWWIWRLPEPMREYLVSVDSAEGGVDGDRAAIHVFDRRTLEQVAEYNGHLDTDLLAHQAAMVCYFYNQAWAIPEVNNTGYGFMNTFKVIWNRIYFREDPEAPVGSPSKWVQGFFTSPTTRPILVTRGANYIREKVPTIHSSRLYHELLTFVKDTRGIPRAAGGAYDDLVLAFFLILQLAESRPVRLEKEKRELTLADDKSFQEHQTRMGRRGYGVKAKFF